MTEFTTLKQKINCSISQSLSRNLTITVMAYGIIRYGGFCGAGRIWRLDGSGTIFPGAILLVNTLSDRSVDEDIADVIGCSYNTYISFREGVFGKNYSRHGTVLANEFGMKLSKAIKNGAPLIP